jgi:phospholipid/cholesterol/gamma-HCH transport system permease protein
MKQLTEVSPTSFDVLSTEAAHTVIRISGRMDQNTAPYLIRKAKNCPGQTLSAKMIVDLSGVTYFDDYGALVLSELKARASEKDGIEILDPAHITESTLSFVDLKNFDSPSMPDRFTENIVENIGENALKSLVRVGHMVSFLGSVFISFGKIISNPKSFRLADTISIMEKTGVNALPIVSLISFLLGLVIAFMSSIQLQQFGANIYVASLVAIAMVSELGPIMTAIVVSGRSGSAFAAEISAMKISEEIDALTTLGFDPVSFLAIPRILASVLVVPILTFFSDIFAILGGLAVGVFLLDLTVSSYISQTVEILTFFEISWGLMKSVVFSLLVSWVGCLRGFEAKGGPDAVGNAATSAVVSGIFLIIVFDSFFAILRSQW